MRRAASPFFWGLAGLLAVVILALVPGTLTRTVGMAILALVVPGYAALKALQSPARFDSLPDLLECCATSLAIAPLALRLAGLVLPFDRLHVVGVLAGISLALLVAGAFLPRAEAREASEKSPAALVLILIATLLLLAPTLVIGPTADGGETRTKGWDLHNHLAVAESIATRGLPPQNPFLSSDVPFYYHTLFHVLLAGVLVAAGPAVHPHLLISLFVLLLAAVLIATFHRLALELTGHARAALFSLPLVSLVGGFDVVPVLGLALREKGSIDLRFPLRHWNVDGWVSNQGMLVPSLFANFYWVPHAVAALIVFMLALRHLRSPRSAGAPIIAAACLASMVGYNAYVALGGATILALLAGSDLARFLATRERACRDLLQRSVLAAGLAVVLCLPILKLYAGGRTDVERFRWARPGPLVPVQLLLEFGPALVLGLAGLLIARRREREAGRWIPAFLMIAVGLPLIGLVASTGENNDLAMRVSMFPWIGLALFGGLALSRLFPAAPDKGAGGLWARLAAISALALGALSVVWFAVGASAGKPALPADEVAAGRWLRSKVPPGLLVQASPLRENPELVYLSGHPAVLSDLWAARLFYSAPDDFSRRMVSLQEAFSALDPAIACSTLRALGIGALVVGPPEERDFPLLARPRPWPCLSQVYQRGAYRIFRVSAPDGSDDNPSNAIREETG